METKMKYCVRHESVVLPRAEFLSFDDALEFAKTLNSIDNNVPNYIVTEIDDKLWPSALLSEAYQVVNQDRRDQYGAPEDEFANVAMMWSAITGAPITAKQVALMMIALKLCREAFNHKHDNLVDIVGYTLCLERCLNDSSTQ